MLKKDVMNELKRPSSPADLTVAFMLARLLQRMVASAAARDTGCEE